MGFQRWLTRLSIGVGGWARDMWYNGVLVYTELSGQVNVRQGFNLRWDYYKRALTSWAEDKRSCEGAADAPPCTPGVGDRPKGWSLLQS